MARDDDEVETRVSNFARRRAGRKRPDKLVPFPGEPGQKARLWVARDEDEQAAEVATRQHLTKGLKLSALDLSLTAEQNLYRAEYERQLLLLLVRDPDDANQQLFESAGEIREELEAPQREALLREIALFRVERYPELTMEELPEDRREGRGLIEWMTEVKTAGALSTYWASFGTDTQYAMLNALIAASTIATPPSS